MKTEVSRLSIALGLALGAVQPVSAQMFYPETMFEAEAANNAAQTIWLKQSLDSASAGAVLQVSPGLRYQSTVPAAGTLGEVEWPFTIDKGTEYTVWVRIQAPSTAADSFYWTFDDQPYKTFYSPNTNTGWQWVKLINPQTQATKHSLSDGKHILRLRYRKAGISIDRIQVTSNRFTQPTGTGFQTMLPPAATHPRLFVTAGGVQALRDRLGAGKLADVWTRVQNNARDVRLQAASPGVSNYNIAAVRAIHANALVYLLGQNENAGKLAVTLAEDFLNKFQYETNTRKLGEAITAVAIVYDWCYPLMVEAQRKNFVYGMRKLAEGMEIKYPPMEQGSVAGHGTEAQLMRDQLAMAIAAYDEVPEMYHTVAGRFFSDFIAPRNYAYEGGVMSAGDSYGPYRLSWDMFAGFIYKRMNNVDLFDASQKQMLYQNLYLRRPDGQLMRDGDSFNTANVLGNYWSWPLAPMLAASYYGDSILQAEFDKQWQAASGLVDDIWMILFHNPNLPADAKSLPLSRYFPAPGGWMIARTGWGTGMGDNSVVATMKMGNTWFAGHQHLDAGHFQLYYKGALALDSGIYEGANGVGFGSDHDFNYHKRTIAHNAMLVMDPNESFSMYGRSVANDGGQKVIGGEPWDMNTIRNQGYEVTSVLKQQIEGGAENAAPDYTYIKGDLKGAYSSKVSAYRRSMVFLNLKNAQVPGALLVFDAVTASNPTFKKTWLLHSQSLPEVDGNTTTIKRGENGYTGKLINTTLLPRSGQARLKIVGSESEPYLVGDVNYPIAPQSSRSSDEPGIWRVELSPVTENASDQFLNVMQVMDGTQTPILPVSGVYGEVFVGAQIGDRTVLFAKNGLEVAANTSFNLTQAGKLLITDLAVGNWQLQSNGQIVANFSVNAEAGSAYLNALPAGTYNLIKQ